MDILMGGNFSFTSNYRKSNGYEGSFAVIFLVVVAGSDRRVILTGTASLSLPSFTSSETTSSPYLFPFISFERSAANFSTTQVG